MVYLIHDKGKEMVIMVSGMFTPSDALNQEKKRNILNTSKGEYNCGGFALGIFAWYLPLPNKFHDRYYSMVNKSLRLTLIYTSRYIVKEISDIRIIKNISELTKDEYAIAYRIGLGDFHFMRRATNGKWYEKCGSRYRIDEVPEEVVFGKSWRDGYYNSDIVLFAKKRGNVK